MVKKIEHLDERKGIFYFRLRIPDDLRDKFNGKAEIKKSLRTRDLATAIPFVCSMLMLLSSFCGEKKKGSFWHEAPNSQSGILIYSLPEVLPRTDCVAVSEKGSTIGSVRRIGSNKARPRHPMQVP